MSSARAVRLTSLAVRTGSQASPVYRSQAALQATNIALQGQSRGFSSKKSTDDDDLGGPGGQEPVDPTARARQNA